MNTAHSTSAIAMIGPLTSCIARTVASWGESPDSMLRSQFSTTTIASSTTIPIASTRPNKVSVLIEKPSVSSTAKVPTTATGTASSGMIEARQVCRNMTTTSATSTMAYVTGSMTLLIDVRTNWFGSDTVG